MPLNRLLVGLTEAWKPHTGSYLQGQKTGLDTSADVVLTYQANSGFPCGFSLKASNYGGSNIATAASSLFDSLGLTDFLISYWLQGSAPAMSDNQISPGFGENNNNGADVGIVFPPGTLPGDIIGEIPGSDGSYPSKSSTGSLITADTPHMVDFSFITATKVLSVCIDNGTVFSATSPVAAGAQDATNTFFLTLVATVGTSECGDVFLWQGSEGVANAITQRSNRYTNKVAYTSFDRGGSVAAAGYNRGGLNIGMRIGL